MLASMGTAHRRCARKPNAGRGVLASHDHSLGACLERDASAGRCRRRRGNLPPRLLAGTRRQPPPKIPRPQPPGRRAKPGGSARDRRPRSRNPVIVRRFLAWARIAPACARADATSALARAFLFTPMSAEQRYEAEVALTVMLDDPSPLVHRAIAEAIASAAEAPRHLITGLVAHGGEAAAIILERTQLLSCADLVDAAALGSERAQIAIARREALPTSVAAALAEVGSLGACLAIIRNRSA